MRHMRGQVAVEAALMLPLLVCLTLGIIQLTSVQHARLLTEYAAFNAVRAGAVWSGNALRMRDAALVSFLPAVGRTDSMPALARTADRARALDAQLQSLEAPLPHEINGVPLRGLVRVETLSPTAEVIERAGGGQLERELDFDAAATTVEAPRRERAASAKALDDDAFRRATVLHVRVRTLYELKLPFAGQALFVTWYAANAGVALFGALDRPSIEHQNITGSHRELGHETMAPRGYLGVHPIEMRALWRLAFEGPVEQRRVMLPIVATASMRMQSNFHRQWAPRRLDGDRP